MSPLPSRSAFDDPPVTRTAVSLRKKKIDAADKRMAAIALLGVLVARTGCTGPGCREGHDDHLKAARLLAYVTQAMPDPDAKPVRRALKGHTLQQDRGVA